MGIPFCPNARYPAAARCKVFPALLPLLRNTPMNIPIVSIGAFGLHRRC